MALRRAIGASSREVLQLLGLPTLRWTAFGVAVGVVAAAGVSSTLSAVAVTFSMPQAATQFAPSTVIVTAVFYAAVVGIAVLVPAVRALSVPPAAILRAE